MLSFSLHTSASAAEQKQYVYDNAHLLTKDETKKLEELAGKLEKSAIPILSFLPQTERAVRRSNSMLGDFYDSHFSGSTAILTIDMKDREVFLSGYKKAETYLNSSAAEYDQKYDLVRYFRRPL
ncbi:TPM domain-containing protein [Bacillus velezensis]